MFEPVPQTRLTFRLICKEAVNLGHGPGESTHSDTMVGCVEDQVLTHDGKANEGKVGSVSSLSGHAGFSASVPDMRVSAFSNIFKLGLS